VPLRSHGSLSLNRALMAAGLVDRVQVTLSLSSPVRPGWTRSSRLRPTSTWSWSRAGRSTVTPKSSSTDPPSIDLYGLCPQLGEQRDKGETRCQCSRARVELRNRVASAGGGRLDRKLVGQAPLIAGEALRGVSASGWMRRRTVMPVSSRRASVSVTSAGGTRSKRMVAGDVVAYRCREVEQVLERDPFGVAEARQPRRPSVVSRPGRRRTVERARPRSVRALAWQASDGGSRFAR
jgi:hypothetical protein